jgi:hypothetical protein
MKRFTRSFVSHFAAIWKKLALGKEDDMRLSLAATYILSLSVASSFAADPDFESYWRDGKAELDGYRITVSRYGEERHGQAVAIYVTEPFSELQRVKVDDPAKDPRDVIDVLKLNLVRDFQTGIYDYNTMVSVFARDSDFSPVKISFSSAEWCGHVYEELLFYPKEVKGQYLSYFEGESETRALSMEKNGILEDNLFILLRGLRGPFLRTGEKIKPRFLPSAYHRRLTHKPLAWTSVEISCAGELNVDVPAGSFTAILYKLKTTDGREGQFFVEKAYPHRIVRWELLPDVAAELTGTIREPYWKLHDNGHESYLKKLGLKPKME